MKQQNKCQVIGCISPKALKETKNGKKDYRSWCNYHRFPQNREDCARERGWSRPPDDRLAAKQRFMANIELMVRCGQPSQQNTPAVREWKAKWRAGMLRYLERIKAKV